MCIWQSGWGCVIGDRRIDGYLYDELGLYRLQWEEMWLKGSSEEEEKKADQGIKRFFWNWTPDLRVGVCRWGGIPPLLLKPPVPPQLRVLPWRWGERPAHLLKKRGVFWHELRSKCCSLFRVHSSLCRWLCLLEFGPSVWVFSRLTSTLLNSRDFIFVSLEVFFNFFLIVVSKHFPFHFSLMASFLVLLVCRRITSNCSRYLALYSFSKN